MKWWCQHVEMSYYRALQERAMLTRIGKGFQYLREVVKLAPGEWTSMLLRMTVKPEVHKFVIDIISALVLHVNHKLREASWLYLSRQLRKKYRC